MAGAVPTRMLVPERLLCTRCLRRTACTGQRRWIGTKYKAKMSDAEEAWQERAEKIQQGTQKNLWDILSERGYVKDTAGDPEVIREIMRRKRIGAYAGIDPTSDSLHVGHLLPLMPLFWMYMHGYRAVTLVGGSTAKVGDPTGRLKSREAIRRTEMTMNMTKMQYQLRQLWTNVDDQARRFGYEKEWSWGRAIVNNGTWWGKETFLDILRRVGAHMRLGPMLSRDTVKNKMEKGDGMSFAEFAYPLMQGWDWFMLMSSQGVQMQIGGSDQFGNIVSGIEVVKAARGSEPDDAKRLPRESVYDDPVGFTVPLLTDSSGVKFGKSAGNAVWLDPFKTPSFDLYGYFVRRTDEEVERLLNLFTFLPAQEIQKTMEEHRADPSKRIAQHLLAHEVLCLVSGAKMAKETQEQHRLMYGGQRTTITTTTTTTTSDEVVLSEQGQYAAVEGHPTTPNNAPRVDMQLPESLILGKSIARILYAAGLATSISDGQRLARTGGAYVAGSPGQPAAVNQGMSSEHLQFTPIKLWFPQDTKQFLISDELLILRKGKHNVRVIQVVSDEEYKAAGKTYPGQPYTGKVRLMRQRLAQLRAELGENATLDPELEAVAEDDDDGAEADEERTRDAIEQLQLRLQMKRDEQAGKQPRAEPE